MIFPFLVTWWYSEQGFLEEQEESGEAGDHRDGDVLPVLAPHPTHPSPQVS